MSQWQIARDFSGIHCGTIDIWRTSISQQRDNIAQFLALLSDQELKRANRYLVEHARTSFVISRGVLRLLLAKYLATDPRTIRFQQNSYGKLFLADSSLQFNLSHSQELALFAFTMDCPLGIDVEFIDQHIEYLDIAERFFSIEEYGMLLALPGLERRQAFFNCWSRKEALIKARGMGLFLALTSFSTEVSFIKDDIVKVTFADSAQPAISNNLFLRSLDPGKQYTAACAVEDYKEQPINFIDF